MDQFIGFRGLNKLFKPFNQFAKRRFGKHMKEPTPPINSDEEESRRRYEQLMVDQAFCEHFAIPLCWIIGIFAGTMVLIQLF